MRVFGVRSGVGIRVGPWGWVTWPRVLWCEGEAAMRVFEGRRTEDDQ